jgi:integrase
MKNHEKASKKYPGIYWRIKNGKRDRMVVAFEGPKVFKDGRWRRNQKWDPVPGKNPTVEDGKIHRDQKLAEVRQGHHGERANASVADVCDAYRAAVIDTQQNPRTRRTYSNQLKRIHDQLGTLRFGELRAEDVEAFLTWLQTADNGRGSTYTALTISETWGRFQHLAAWAVRRDYAVRNPFDKVERKAPARTRSREVRPFSREDRDRFLAFLGEAHPHLFAIFRLWFDAGLRHSELLGAQWQLLDINLATYRVETQFIDGSLSAPKGTARKSKPMTEVVLGPSTIRALEDYRLREALRRGLREAPTEGLMFCEPSGKPLSRHGEVTQFESLLREAELPRRTPHDIRHTTASIMIAEGASVLQVQHQMRHATPTVTLNTYGHLMPMDRRSGFGTNGELTPPTISQTGTDE